MPNTNKATYRSTQITDEGAFCLSHGVLAFTARTAFIERPNASAQLMLFPSFNANRAGQSYGITWACVCGYLVYMRYNLADLEK